MIVDRHFNRRAASRIGAQSRADLEIDPVGLEAVGVIGEVGDGVGYRPHRIRPACVHRVTVTQGPVRYTQNQPLRIDLAGQEHFKNVRSTFYKGAQGALAVYSTVERSSFDNLPNWINECWHNAGKKIPIVVIGNKIDLREQFKDNPVMKHNIVTTEEGRQFAEQLAQQGVHTSFIETSAKTGENVEAAFLELAIKILEAGGLS